MPLALVVEDGTGKPNANAFASVGTVTTKLEAVPFTDAWASVETPEVFVAEASAWLSRLAWDGTPTTSAQALAWPRTGTQRPDGTLIGSNVVPPFVVEATARLAFWLSQQTSTPYTTTGLVPGTELALPGGLRLTPQASNAVLPPDVRQLLAPYVRGGASLVRA